MADILTQLKTFLDEEGLNAYHSENIKKINATISSHDSSSTSHEDMRSDISDINKSILGLQSNSHVHSNKLILDNTSASFTSDLKDKLDSVEVGANLYTLPVSSQNSLGGIKIGNNVQIANDGTVSILDGSTSEKGVVILEDSTTSSSTSTAATPNSVKIAYDLADTVNKALNRHYTYASSHSDIRDLISELDKRLTTLADCDDETLDQLSEIVAYIKNNRTLIDEVTTKKVNVEDIIDNLTTNVSTKPLSAAQGVILKTEVDSNLEAQNAHINNKSNPHGVTLSELGITASTEEVNFISGAASNIQMQLNSKLSLPSSNSYGTVGQFAVSDGNGGITWTTIVDGNNVAY